MALFERKCVQPDGYFTAESFQMLQSGLMGFLLQLVLF